MLACVRVHMKVRGRGHFSPGWSTALLRSCTQTAQHSNDVLKSIFRFPWESGSFRGGQKWLNQVCHQESTQVGTVRAEAGSLCCAQWICFSQEHLPCERIPAGSPGLTTGPDGAGRAGQETLVSGGRLIHSAGPDSSLESGRP